MAGLAVLVSWEILNGSQDFFHTFSMALYHKWNVKNDFAYKLQFFSLISDSLDSVYRDVEINTKFLKSCFMIGVVAHSKLDLFLCTIMIRKHDFQT